MSADHDPLFEFQRWKANLRILEIEPVKTVPYVPLSHPFVERLIGTVRRELLDRTPFCNARDLERKLTAFKVYYNGSRVHRALGGQTRIGLPSPQQALGQTSLAKLLSRALRAPISGVNTTGCASAHPDGGHLNIAPIMRPRSGEPCGAAAWRIISWRYV